MSTPLRTALIGLFTLCASALFSQVSWDVVETRQDVIVEATVEDCNGSIALLLRFTNNTGAGISFDYEVKSRTTAHAVSGSVTFADDDPKTTVNDCMRSATGLSQHYIYLGTEDLPLSNFEVTLNL